MPFIAALASSGPARYHALPQGSHPKLIHHGLVIAVTSFAQAS
jgi:hypothetical protein